MMTGEARLWRYLREGMGSCWHAQRHEDKFSSGVPDVSYALDGVDGWIELKALPAWPKRAETVVKIGLTREQVAWLELRERRGCQRAWVLLKVGKGAGAEYLLFRLRENHSTGRCLLQGMNRMGLTDLGYMWPGKIDFYKLAQVLRRGDHEAARDLALPARAVAAGVSVGVARGLGRGG